MAIANALRARVEWTSTQKQDIDMNVFGLVLTAGAVVDQTLADAVGTAVLNAYNNSTWDSRIATTYTLSGVFVRDLRTDNQAEIAAAITPAAGLSAQDEYAYNTAVVVTLRTGLAGRSFRGRMYLSGFTETAVDAGVLLPAAVTDALSYAQGLFNSFAVVGGIDNLGIISETLQLITPVPGLSSIVIRSGILGTQRRRQERP
jgi:hypothetical protein